MTAKTKDGKEVFKESKIYMPQASNSRGDAAIYGAQYKMGLIRDTSLQPSQSKKEKFEIKFPDEKTKEMDITVELRYQLASTIGEVGKNSFIIYNTTKKVNIQ